MQRKKEKRYPKAWRHLSDTEMVRRALLFRLEAEVEAPGSGRRPTATPGKPDNPVTLCLVNRMDVNLGVQLLVWGAQSRQARSDPCPAASLQAWNH